MKRRELHLNTQGVTLVETLIALLIVMALCGGLYKTGWSSRRYADYARLATESRTRGKELLEELYSYPLSDLQQPAFVWRSETNISGIGIEYTRTPRVVWHEGGTGRTNAEAAAYAEIHVDVVFPSPLWGRPVTNTFSILKKE